MSNKRRPGREQWHDPNSGKTIFVGGLQEKTKEVISELRTLFEKCGTITEISLELQRPPFAAFIVLGNAEEAQRAVITFDGYKLPSRNWILRVQRKKGKTEGASEESKSPQRTASVPAQAPSAGPLLPARGSPPQSEPRSWAQASAISGGGSELTATPASSATTVMSSPSHGPITAPPGLGSPQSSPLGPLPAAGFVSAASVSVSGLQGSWSPFGSAGSTWTNPTAGSGAGSSSGAGSPVRRPEKHLGGSGLSLPENGLSLGLAHSPVGLSQRGLSLAAHALSQHGGASPVLSGSGSGGSGGQDQMRQAWLDQLERSARLQQSSLEDRIGLLMHLARSASTPAQLQAPILRAIEAVCSKATAELSACADQLMGQRSSPVGSGGSGDAIGPIGSPHGSPAKGSISRTSNSPIPGGSGSGSSSGSPNRNLFSLNGLGGPPHPHQHQHQLGHQRQLQQQFPHPHHPQQQQQQQHELGRSWDRQAQTQAHAHEAHTDREIEVQRERSMGGPALLQMGLPSLFVSVPSAL